MKWIKTKCLSFITEWKCCDALSVALFLKIYFTLSIDASVCFGFIFGFKFALSPLLNRVNLPMSF